jgi:2-polyprenyl-6-methoxyphenol hydroxylase-like FAD-dependent oxidoreductase
MQQFDLIIVGGGLAGASLALALRNTRLRIALVESQPPVALRAGMRAFMPSARLILSSSTA